jgi:hypothetical protein
MSRNHPGTRGIPQHVAQTAPQQAAQEDQAMAEDVQDGYGQYSTRMTLIISDPPVQRPPPLLHHSLGSHGSVLCLATSISAKSRRISSKTTSISRD